MATRARNRHIHAPRICKEANLARSIAAGATVSRPHNRRAGCQLAARSASNCGMQRGSRQVDMRYDTTACSQRENTLCMVPRSVLRTPGPVRRDVDVPWMYCASALPCLVSWQSRCSVVDVHTAHPSIISRDACKQHPCNSSAEHQQSLLTFMHGSYCTDTMRQRARWR
jgi:hypothetical protein